jgi:hypothetical protein
MTLIQRLLGAALTLLLLLAAALVASIALGVALAAGLAAWAWLWWRSRSLPRGRMRRDAIEGEFRDVTHLEGLEERGGERL